jgi:hypothetical protein
VVTADPHLEEVVPYAPAVMPAAALRLAPPLGGFVAAFVLMPGRWLVITVFFVGGACLAGLLSFLFTWRKLRRQLAAAPPVPPGAVEAERHGVRVREIGAFLFELAFLLAAGSFWAAFQDSRFAAGLVFAAALLGAGAVGDVALRWRVGRWERRNGCILTSLLLGPGEVFYVERSARAA